VPRMELTWASGSTRNAGLLVITKPNPLVKHLLGLLDPVTSILVPDPFLHLPGLGPLFLELVLVNQINRTR